MNPHRLEELLLAWEEDALTPAEHAELKQLLATSPEARQRLVEAGVLGQIAASHLVPTRAAAPTLATPARQGWRPFTAAAAGLMLGCFSTSMVWALSGPVWSSGLQRLLLPLANPGFEQPQELPQTHLVPVTDQWSGISTAIVVGGRERPAARSGQRMMKLGPAPEGKGYFANLMTDLAATRPLTDKPLQIEITAHYHASKPGQNEHYSLNAATFAGDAASVSQQWENTWRDLRDACLTHTGKAIFPTADEAGWHRLTVRLDVPPEARTLVLSLGSNTPGPIAGRTDHFMDDVTATWIIVENSPPL